MKRFMRYFGLALAILFLFWIIGVAVVYFFVDVNDIKKFAVTTVNQNTTGELSLGETKLKVFPFVHFEIKDIVFKSSPNFDKQDMFSCKDAKLSFNLFTLIIGKPRITLKVDKPSLNFVSDGKTNNISDAFKSGEKKKSSTDVLTYLFISKFSFNINDASIRYKTPKDLYEIKDLDLNLDIDPVSRNLDLDISTPIDYKKLDTIIKGDLKLSVDVNLISKDRSEIKATVDASKLLISTKAIEKKKGDALKITVLAESDLKNKIVIKDITLVLIDELLKINGAVDNFSSDKPEVDLTAKPSNKFDVSALAKVMKSLKDYKMSGKLDGSISIKGNLPKEGTSNSLGVIGNIDATNTEIQSGSFSKTNKMPLKVMINVDTDLKSMDINQFQVFLHTAEDKDLLALAVKGAIKNFSDEKPIYDLNVEKLNVNLSYFGKQIPALAKYPVAGSLSSRAKITGSMSPLPIIDLQAEYKDDVNKNNVNLKVSNTEKSRNLVVADISSSYINLTPYLPPVEKSTKAKASKGSAAASASGVSAPTSKSDEDMVVLKKETIESVKKALDKYSIKLNAKVDKLISRELTINNFILNGSFNKDEIAINKMNLSLLKGDMAGNLKVGLNVSNPTYAGKLDLKGIKVKDAADIFMPGIKGVIDGVVSFGVDLNTSGYSMKPIKKNMVAKGNFAFNNFVYSGQELNSLINDKLKDKLGALGYSGDKKILGTNPGWETVQGTFNIKDGKINIEQLLAKEKEYEATGKGELTFNEYMDMFIDVTVPYKNIPYEAIKVEGKDRSMLPLHLTGPILKPKFDAEYLLKYLAQKTLDFQTKKLKEAATKEAEKLKQQATAKAQAEAKKAVAPLQQKANDELKKAFKGFKF